jgi:hypothetical protein
VNLNFHTNAGKVGETVRYIAHREESLPQRSRVPSTASSGARCGLAANGSRCSR